MCVREADAGRQDDKRASRHALQIGRPSEKLFHFKVTTATLVCDIPMWERLVCNFMITFRIEIVSFVTFQLRDRLI